MDISISKAGGIVTIEFNRPDKKNAIAGAMYQAMANALREADADAGVRVILFCGKPEIFTAGNDLEDFMKNPPDSINSPVYQFMWALSHANKPVIAAVAGGVVGIGTTMLMHCDLVYAADNAKFSMPFTQLGLCPEFASSLLLPQLAGGRKAAEKLMLGESFPAEDALAMGLVNRVLPVTELLPYAQAQAAKLAALPAASISASKRLMKSHLAEAIDAKMAEENKDFAEMLTGPAAKEAFSAFFEKRRPDFTKLP